MLQGHGQGVGDHAAGVRRRKAQGVGDSEGRAHRPLGGGDGVGAQRVFEEVAAGGQHQALFGRPLRARRRRGAAGQQDLHGTDQVAPAAFQDELQHSGLLVGEDFLQHFQGWPVGFQAEGQRDGPRRALDQKMTLLGGGVVLGAVRAALGVAPVFLHGVPPFIHGHDLGALWSEAVLAFDRIWGAPLVRVFVAEGLRSSGVCCTAAVPKSLLSQIWKAREQLGYN